MMLAEMNSLSDNPLTYLFLGLEDILSPVDIEKILRTVFAGNKPQSALNGQAVKKIRKTMNEMYGEEGTRGLLMCSGRAAFKYLLSQRGKDLGFETDVFRYAPSRIKMKRGLEILAKWINLTNTEGVEVKAADKTWLLEVKRAGDATLEAGNPMCDYIAGLVQGFLFWAGGGRYYRVLEIDCAKKSGDVCRFAIDKTPLD